MTFVTSYCYLYRRGLGQSGVGGGEVILFLEEEYMKTKDGGTFKTKTEAEKWAKRLGWLGFSYTQIRKVKYGYKVRYAK